MTDLIVFCTIGYAGMYLLGAAGRLRRHRLIKAYKGAKPSNKDCLLSKLCFDENGAIIPGKTKNLLSQKERALFDMKYTPAVWSK
jgi:hypothetical protein